MLITGMSLLSACGPDSFLDRREVYTDDGLTAKVRFDVDWLTRFCSSPTGMTVMAFPEKGVRTETQTNSVSSTTMELAKGGWRMLIFNLTPDEFGALSFSGLDDYDSLRVSLNEMPSGTSRAWDDGMTYRREPDEIGTATDTIAVTSRMVDDSYRARQTGNDTLVYVFNETPRVITTSLNVRVRVKGLKYARSMEGSISGMADGYMLTQHHPVNSGDTHKLSEWSMKLDSPGSADGYATTTIKTFGLPFNDGGTIASRDSTANTLRLYFLLRDGKTTRTYQYNVGHLFHYVTTDGGQRAYTTERTMTLDLIFDEGNIPQLPAVDDDNKGTGFDAHVDPWDDGGNTNINL